MTDEKNINYIKSLLKIPFIIHLGSGKWLKYSETYPGVFSLIGENLDYPSLLKDGEILNFTHWDEDVKNLDKGAVMKSTGLEISSHLQYKNVSLLPEHIEA